MMKLQKIMTDFTHITLSMHFAIQYRETSDGLLLALPLLCLSLSLTFSSWWADGRGDRTERSFVLFLCPQSKKH